MTNDPLVSVVIPTTGRPELLTRAIPSVLGQEYDNFEIIVVADGVDLDLGALDPRISIIPTGSRVGAAAARNLGVRMSSGAYVAFLDDDDAWHPKKLRMQVAECSQGIALVGCRLRAVTPRGSYVWPRSAVFAPDQPMSEFLFRRRSPFRGDGSFPTSTMLGPRQTFSKIPFDDTLPMHQDFDMALRIAAAHPSSIVQLDTVLVDHYVEEGRTTISTNSAWEFSLGWLATRRALFTDGAAADFCLTIAGSQASDVGLRPIVTSLRCGVANGRPSAWALFSMMSFALLPRNARRRARAIVLKASKK